MSADRSKPPTGRAVGVTGWFFTVAALVPVAWLVAFALLVLRARAITGHWPVPYQPDPANVGGIAANVIAGKVPIVHLLGSAAAVCLGFALAIAPLRTALREAGFQNWHAYIGLLGIVLIAIFMHADPWQLSSWLADQRTSTRPTTGNAIRLLQ